MPARLAAHLVVVDAPGVLAHAVVIEGVAATGEVHRVPVREMAAVGQAHGQHHFPGLQSRYVGGLIGGGAGVRLYVRVLGAVEGLCPLDGEGLDLVDPVATPVVALAGIAFSIFVGEDAPHRFQDGHRSEVLRGDQLDVVLLALKLFFDELADDRVGLRQG